jgi:hypothetical protein
MVAMLVFLDRHNIMLTCDEDELFKTSVLLADHKFHDKRFNRTSDGEIYALATWITKNSKQIEKGERPIKLKKLKQTLQEFDCTFDSDNRITRSVTSSFFAIPIVKNLTSNRIPSSLADGKEVDKGIIKSIREDLSLTENDGIDSHVFYDGDTYTTSEFIVKYRKTLKRLSHI